MKNKLIEVFCEIVEEHSRITLFSIISMITMLFVMVIEYLGLTTSTTDFIASCIVFVSALGFAIDYMQDELL